MKDWDNGSREWTDINEAPAGFIFSDNNGALSDSVPISKKELRTIPSMFGNEDKLFVRCKNCSSFMNYTTGKRGNFSGQWKCPHCGKVVPEMAAYNKLDEENTEFENQFNNLYNDDF